MVLFPVASYSHTFIFGIALDSQPFLEFLEAQLPIVKNAPGPSKLTVLIGMHLLSAFNCILNLVMLLMLVLGITFDRAVSSIDLEERNLSQVDCISKQIKK